MAMDICWNVNGRHSFPHRCGATNQPNPIQSNHADDEAPNPYCVVTVGKQSYKSKKKTKTFHPSWSNATFVLYVHITLFQFSSSPFPEF